ncbi:MAG: hypothetical protein PF689_09420 [Deltaproteobacteria bacterium]|nr:hypothetical protein [Deltaproteobacteria bacterium]
MILKKVYPFIYFFFFSFIAVGCSTSESQCEDENCNNQEINIVLVYGSSTCGRCTSLSNGLEINHIDHEFYDVNDNAQLYEEMNFKFYSVFPEDEQLIIPIVDVNGTILMNPSVLQVKSYLWENQ